MKRLGVNIDHIATLRNARGEIHPSPIQAAKIAIKSGADSITLHLREDRRHIKDKDFLNIVKIKNIPINLEMAATNEMTKIAIKHKPNFVCIVPENRKEITTEGGLNLYRNKNKLMMILNKLNKKKIRTSLFINPNLSDVILSKNLGTKCVELHTGKISNIIKKKQNYLNELKKIKKCAKKAVNIGMEVHVGHGIDYKTAKILARINEIKEFNIGHFIIGESIFNGFRTTIKKFIRIVR
ncbi:MAG TPA: pyridoxine 5'-phosphate synthase [Candidatus Pelagibacter bacterium]|jgi:pyridoxine 5-phosphate synthase|nr:pyridoxine 5'-phosphate synthase [Pelagibacteraceae bacterium]HJN84586.1 pyridoxine 5'-phosphate synthase [Candidatus Pelagibacter bacterium]|tara:strand:+ start:576 stop:1292 length:717 start_codon:yes stop_codon:yes gene_type:complete